MQKFVFMDSSKNSENQTVTKGETNQAKMHQRSQKKENCDKIVNTINVILIIITSS